MRLLSPGTAAARRARGRRPPPPVAPAVAAWRRFRRYGDGGPPVDRSPVTGVGGRSQGRGARGEGCGRGRRRWPRPPAALRCGGAGTGAGHAQEGRRRSRGVPRSAPPARSAALADAAPFSRPGPTVRAGQSPGATVWAGQPLRTRQSAPLSRSGPDSARRPVAPVQQSGRLGRSRPVNRSGRSVQAADRSGPVSRSGRSAFGLLQPVDDVEEAHHLRTALR